MKWQLWDDYHDVIRGQIGSHRITRPPVANLAIFLIGKACSLSLAFVIPALVIPSAGWVLFYLLVSAINGVSLAVVFQLAHVVEGAAFSAARRSHRPHGTPLGHSSGRDHRGLRPRQPRNLLAAGRLGITRSSIISSRASATSLPPYFSAGRECLRQIRRAVPHQPHLSSPAWSRTSGGFAAWPNGRLRPRVSGRAANF